MTTRLLRASKRAGESSTTHQEYFFCIAAPAETPLFQFNSRLADAASDACLPADPLF
jgi:hypothetical protein